MTWGYVPPPGFTFIGFSVQYTYEGPCPDTDIDPIFSSVPQGLQQQHQENLIPFSEYTVTVAAVHSDSLILTDSATVTTLPTSKRERERESSKFYLLTDPGPPSNVRATDLTTSAATIEWDPLPCLEEHDEIMEYRVDIGFSGSVSKYTVTSDDGSSLRMTGLTRGNSYFFEVYAVGNSTDSELRGAGSAIHLQTLSGNNLWLLGKRNIIMDMTLMVLASLDHVTDFKCNWLMASYIITSITATSNIYNRLNRNLHRHVALHDHDHAP